VTSSMPWMSDPNYSTRLPPNRQPGQRHRLHDAATPVSYCQYRLKTSRYIGTDTNPATSATRSGLPRLPDPAQAPIQFASRPEGNTKTPTTSACQYDRRRRHLFQRTSRIRRPPPGPIWKNGCSRSTARSLLDTMCRRIPSAASASPEHSFSTRS